MLALVLTTALVLVAIAALELRRTRAAALANLRRSWGQPLTRTHRLDAIASSHRSRVCHVGSSASLDDRTWADLGLDQVFAAIDRTQGTLGQHALYHRLRTSPVGDHLEAFERVIRRMSTNSTTRERAQVALARLQDPHGYDLWWLARADAVELPPWYAVFPVLTAAAVLLLILTAVWPELLPAMFAILGLNVCVRWFSGYEIVALASTFRQLPSVIAAGESLAFLTENETDEILGSIEVDGASLDGLKSLARWFTGDPFLLPMNSRPHVLIFNDVVNTIYEYFNLVLLLDATGVYFGAGALRRNAAALLRLAVAIGDVDAAISVASLRAGRTDWVRPDFQLPGSAVLMSDIVHPLVPSAVPNTMTSRLGAGVLVTGSNMSGKSTFLRAVGVSAIMAQTLNTCFASAYCAPVLRVRSSIGRGDDLVGGKSYYLVEVESLLGLVASSREPAPHLFLLDELFRGTNAIERIAAAEAVLVELLRGADRVKPHLVLAATHDGELVDLLAETYAACHFGDAIGDQGLVFDYRLQPGRATTRNAIALLRLHGAPEALVGRATSRAATLDRERGSALTAR
jgi:hypothetical protein